MAKKKTDGGILETIKTVLIALLLAGVFRTLIVQPFYIPSGSMKPTLLIGDFLFVNKMAYGYSRNSCPMSICPIEGRILGREPERGDIVVFRHPTSGVDLIKRLVAVPGDIVQMIDGRLHLNGTAVPLEPAGTFVEPYVATRGSFPRCAEGTIPAGGTCTKAAYRETLPNGVSYTVLDVTDVGSDTTRPVTVPEKSYYFMGDNRDNSRDSRTPQRAGGLGFVPYENLIGRARHVIFSARGDSLFFFWTWRSDRFFVDVRDE